MALVTLVIGLALLLFGSLYKHAPGGERLLAVGLGVVVIFIGVALIAPKFVPPLAGALGGRAPGSVASPDRSPVENAMRNPARTASTAAALMIGLALVTAVGVLAAGLKTTFGNSVKKQFNADYALTSENGFTPDRDRFGGRGPCCSGGREDLGCARGECPRLRSYDRVDGCRTRCRPRDQHQVGERRPRGSRQSSGRMAPSWTRTTRRNTICLWARRSPWKPRRGSCCDLKIDGDL